METLRFRKAALILLFCAFVQSNAIMPKPGNCPRIFETFVALPTCKYDRDCPGDQKCCTFFSRSVCAPPIPTLPGCPMHRPGDMGTCLEQCSSDSDCPGIDEICCFNGCGHVCVTQTPVKPGLCKPDDFFTPRCHSHCENDGDCRGELKCCPSFCGNVCKFPWFWPL